MLHLRNNNSINKTLKILRKIVKINLFFYSIENFNIKIIINLFTY